MGNCNFKTEKDKESVPGMLLSQIIIYQAYPKYSNHKKSFSISICSWKRWLWEGVESWKEKREIIIRNERNVESKNNG